ncbi:hypothetical protein ACUN0C_18755 [Faunimonas sp. B44]|uniref:hypothetical protein n=1 Tax=Faunimonas sp. B44 TaxID=3461493 RepID=UPI004044F11E
MPKPKIDLDEMSPQELEELHAELMAAQERKKTDYQNELIERYQRLRDEMVKWGVISDDFPRLKRRGWTRRTSQSLQ